MPGFRPDADRAMGAFDLFIMPSRYEGFGLTLIEAMSHGLPVIASGADSLPELLEGYTDGRIVSFDPGHETEAAEAILQEISEAAPDGEAQNPKSQIPNGEIFRQDLQDRENKFSEAPCLGTPTVRSAIFPTLAKQIRNPGPLGVGMLGVPNADDFPSTFHSPHSALRTSAPPSTLHSPHFSSPSPTFELQNSRTPELSNPLPSLFSAARMTVDYLQLYERTLHE
jgi:hypothetical protein